MREQLAKRCLGAASAVAMLLALGIVLLGTAGCAAVPSISGEVVPIRVLVYNIHAGRDAAGVDNLRRVADLVLESRADLILLQEVDRRTRRSGGIDQVAELASLTGYHAAFGNTLDYQGGEYGIAVLSRWGIEEDTLIRLAVHPVQQRAGGSYEPRGVLHVRVATPRGDLHVLNTHLDASAEDGYRLQEVATVLRIANRLRAGNELVLFGGDLNANPESAVISMVKEGDWTDAWAGCGSGEGWTYPADAPVKRIDYLILPPALRCDSAAVLETDASDHRPVLFIVSPRRG